MKLFSSPSAFWVSEISVPGYVLPFGELLLIGGGGNNAHGQLKRC